MILEVFHGYNSLAANTNKGREGGRIKYIQLNSPTKFIQRSSSKSYCVWNVPELCYIFDQYKKYHNITKPLVNWIEGRTKRIPG